mgnify:FL=1
MSDFIGNAATTDQSNVASATGNPGSPCPKNKEQEQDFSETVKATAASTPDVSQDILGNGMAFVKEINQSDVKDLVSILERIKLQEGKYSRFSLDGGSVTFLCSTFSTLFPENQARSMIALTFLLLPASEQKVDPFCEAVGIGKDRLYRGIQELLENGLTFDSIHANAPGAGRPDATCIFRQYMNAICSFMGISQEDLEGRSDQIFGQNKAADILQEKQKADSKDLADSVGEDGTPAQETKSEDTGDAKDPLEAIAANLVEELTETLKLFDDPEKAWSKWLVNMTKPFVASLRRWADELLEVAAGLGISAVPASVSEAEEGSLISAGSEGTTEPQGPSAAPAGTTEVPGPSAAPAGNTEIQGDSAASEGSTETQDPSRKDGDSKPSKTDSASLKKKTIIQLLAYAIDSLQDIALEVLAVMNRIGNLSGNKVPHQKIRKLLGLVNPKRMNIQMKRLMGMIKRAEEKFASLEKQDDAQPDYLKDMPVIDTDENGKPIVAKEEGLRGLDLLEENLGKKLKSAQTGSGFVSLICVTTEQLGIIRQWLQMTIPEEILSHHEYEILAIQAAVVSLINVWVKDWDACRGSWDAVKRLAHAILDRTELMSLILNEVKYVSLKTEAASDKNGDSAGKADGDSSSGSETDAEDAAASPEKYVPDSWLRTSLHLEEALENLDALIKRLEQAFGVTDDASRQAMQNKKGKEALRVLAEMKEHLQEAVSDGLSEDVSVRIAQAILIERIFSWTDSWLKAWAEYKTESQAKRAVSVKIAAASVKVSLSIDYGNYRKAIKSEEDSMAKNPEDPAEAVSGKDEAAARKVSDEMRNEVRGQADETVKLLNEVDTMLAEELKHKRESSKGRAPIQNALEKLAGLRKRVQDELANAEKTDDLCPWTALQSVLKECMLPKAAELKAKCCKDVSDENRLSQNAVQRVISAISGKRAEKRFLGAWEQYDASRSGSESGSSDPYKEIPEPGPNPFKCTKSIPVDETVNLAWKFWNEGKDPADIKTWLAHIMEVDYARLYGDPTKEKVCCKITYGELANALHYFTGMTFSTDVLWAILVGEMGYSGRQCRKLDQVGVPCPSREEQFEYIKMKIESINPDTDLILSADTKAMIVLGRLKRDNQVLMCSPGQGVYRVKDHDFPFLMDEIYPNGTDLVDKSRMGERAVLHPVGVYCKNDNTGYICLVLGKDTAESMANLIIKVIGIKRKEYSQNIKNILLLTDGGGVSTANGILWSRELLRIADDANVEIDMSHYPSGASKHNMIEHKLFGPISRQMAGRPALNIELVARSIQETTAVPKDGGIKPLKVTCWFDSRHYKSLSEKKKDPSYVAWTREDLDREANGRITHPFEPGTAMYNLNYHVVPSKSA